jgi:NitT/TauT family transport system permease protein
MSQAATNPSAHQQDPALSPVAYAGFVLALLGVWHVLTLWVGRDVLPGPGETLGRLWHMLSTGSLNKHLIETFSAFGMALVIAVIIGVLSGAILGAHRLSGEVAEPMLVALYSIPKVTLYPIMLLLFGLGMAAKVAFGVIHGVIPICIFTMSAVRAIPKKYIRAGQAMQLTPSQMFWKIYMPACIPEVFSGLRIGFSLTLLGTLIGEMFASQRGIGHLLLQAMENSNLLDITALVVMLVTLAAFVGFTLLSIDRRLASRAALA